MTQENWKPLFKISMEIIKHTKDKFSLDILPYMSFGGGTALQQYINHRISDDIDIFIDDPQLLGYLNPFQQEYELSQTPDSYEIDSYCFLKITYNHIGDIDFICSNFMTDNPYNKKDILGHTINIETPAEIIAKKIFYRGNHMAIRDVFDIAAVSKIYGKQYLHDNLFHMKDKCKVALEHINKWDNDKTLVLMDSLRVINGFDKLKEEALSITKEILSEI